MYRGPEKAYASLDFTGIGLITEQQFLDSLVCKSTEFTEEEMRDFFFLSNIFKNGMNFDNFKKTFFPHLY